MIMVKFETSMKMTTMISQQTEQRRYSRLAIRIPLVSNKDSPSHLQAEHIAAMLTASTNRTASVVYDCTIVVSAFVEHLRVNLNCLKLALKKH